MSEKVLNILNIVGNLSLVGIVITFLGNYFENKKTRYTGIVTKQTLANLLFVRENYVELATLSKPEVIDAVRNNPDFNYEYKIVRAIMSMESQFKHIFENERDLMSTARELCKTCLKYYAEPNKELDEKIRRLGKQYDELMAIYDYSDWLYVKEQAREKAYKKSVANFDRIYEENKPVFAQKKKPVRW